MTSDHRLQLLLRQATQPLALELENEMSFFIFATMGRPCITLNEIDYVPRTGTDCIQRFGFVQNGTISSGRVFGA
jgi:hypothetical protein